MLLIMYQILSSLLGHLPFSMHFLLHFYGVTFFGTPNIMVKVINFAQVVRPEPGWRRLTREVIFIASVANSASRMLHGFRSA